MLVYLIWKDPDFGATAVIHGVTTREFHELPQVIQDRLHHLYVGEYLSIVIDTENGHVELRP